MLAVLAALAGCGTGPVQVDAPSVSAADARACRRLVADLPDTLAGQQRREVAGGTGLVAAWGDPAIVLTCGVPRPEDFNASSTCIEANGVGWFVPDSVLLADDQSKDVTMTAVGYRPRVQVLLPGDYRPDGFPDTTGALAKVVARDTRLVTRCR